MDIFANVIMQIWICYEIDTSSFYTQETLFADLNFKVHLSSLLSYRSLNVTISWKIWIFFIVVTNWNFLTKYLFNKYFWVFLFFVFIGILVSSATRKEPAVICYRVCQGLGLCIVFFSAIALSLLYKVCLIGGTLVLGVIGYLVMEVSNNPVTPQENRAFDV